MALWFHELTATARVSMKPHASPVLHAVNHLLGDLDERHLPTLRQRGGLQSYPSRSKDPDTVDFSTGSVGIGATATIWAAMAYRYASSQFPDTPPAGRFVALLGDAELDEGAIWEAVADPQVASLGELLWVVDGHWWCNGADLGPTSGSWKDHAELRESKVQALAPEFATPDEELADMIVARAWHCPVTGYRIDLELCRAGEDPLVDIRLA